ncbi:RDD family protein [Luteolibacter algae]|uniref:RDD family protein n=1 Tax=Luteolibacter algae TaxID=454151 RepID=A0ABW5DAJ5_9BACT
MEIWLIQNGKKRGPYPDYDIRSRIAHRELDPETIAWHEGLAEWTEIGKMDLFRKEFPEKESVATPPELPRKYLERAESAETVSPSATELPKPRKYLIRRFWARWLDLTFYTTIWWLLMYLAGKDIGLALLNPWLQLSLYIPWFALEAWMLQRNATTLGKWLMGLRVINEDGSKLHLKNSVWRSVRVMVTGIGFGWGLLSLLCQAMSWFTTRRIGKPIWDYLGAHKVVASELNALKIIVMVFLFFVCAQLQLAVKGPHLQKMMLEKNPEYKEFFEQANLRYFPINKK